MPHTRGSTLWHRSVAREPSLTAREREAQREYLRARDLGERAAELAEKQFQQAALRAGEEGKRELRSSHATREHGRAAGFGLGSHSLGEGSSPPAGLIRPRTAQFSQASSPEYTPADYRTLSPGN